MKIMIILYFEVDEEGFGMETDSSTGESSMVWGMALLAKETLETSDDYSIMFD